MMKIYPWPFKRCPKMAKLTILASSKTEKKQFPLREFNLPGREIEREIQIAYSDLLDSLATKLSKFFVLPKLIFLFRQKSFWCLSFRNFRSMKKAAEDISGPEVFRRVTLLVVFVHLLMITLHAQKNFKTFFAFFSSESESELSSKCITWLPAIFCKTPQICSFFKKSIKFRA